MKNLYQRFIMFILSIFRKHQKSNMELWAEKEVAIACTRERAESKTGPKEWDYGCACYESALKAFKSLLGDGHSGFSIGMTKQILIRLIDGLPLTPIEDTPDIWDEKSWEDDLGRDVYQCKRMSSLFKHVAKDGTAEYSANDYVYCVNINTRVTYSNGFVRNLIEKMWPITMPYYPGKPIFVYCGEPLTDPKNGDFDSLGIYYAVKGNGDRVDINRYFKESIGQEGLVEIDNEEWTKRLVKAAELLKNPKEKVSCHCEEARR